MVEMLVMQEQLPVKVSLNRTNDRPWMAGLEPSYMDVSKRCTKSFLRP
jgi:hypothetical protein